MDSVVAVAVAFFIYRSAFHGLPLHMDTAFYVPNRVVATGGWGTFSGWNAHFSAASRLLPQLTHTALFRVGGPDSYPSGFRWLYAFITLATGVAAGLLAQAVAGGSPYSSLAAWAATIAYLQLASETQYGVYFESAEVFQALFQCNGVLLCVCGLEQSNAWMTAAGVLLLWFDAVLVKLTGFASASLISLAIAWQQPTFAPWLAACALVAVAAYASILYANGGRFAERMRYLKQHERYIRRNYPSTIMLLVVKVAFAARLVFRNPAIPLVAASIMLVYPRAPIVPGAALSVLAAYAASLIVGFVSQGHRVWYYVVPFLPLTAVSFGCAALGVAERVTPAFAVTVAGAACFISLIINLAPRLMFDVRGFTRWVFSVYNRPGGRFGDAMAEGNLAVMESATKWRKIVRGSPVLVLGAFNQASVVVGGAYDTPLGSICPLAEGTSGNLEQFLTNIERVPPEFVFDTEHVFETYRERWDWLTDFQVVASHAQVRLYRREA